MFEFDRNVEISSLEEEIQRIKKLNKKFINIHELNKKTNDSIIFKVNNDLPSGMILVDELTDFSKGIQNIYRKAINSRIEESKKRIKKYIKESTGLVISNVRAGSFEIEMKQHRTQVINKSSNLDFEQLTNSVYEPSLSALTNVIDSLYSENVSNIILEYDIETFKAAKEWIKNLSKTSNDFEYKENFTHKSYDFTHKKIVSISKLLENLHEDIDETLEINGILSVVNHQKSTITIDDIHTNENYLIQINDNKFKDLEFTTNKNVIAEVQVHEVNIGDEKISTEMFLNDIEKLKFV